MTAPGRPAGVGCAAVLGSPQIWLSFDGGATFVESALLREPHRYAVGPVWGPGELLLAVEHDRAIYSPDRGCQWGEIGPIQPMHGIVAAPTGAVAWERSGEGASITVDEVRPWTRPGGIAGLAPTPDGRLVALDPVGERLESSDGGVSWHGVGRIPLDPPLVYAAAWDPTDPKHLVVGLVKHGVIVSFDGGDTFEPATGLGPPGSVNGFTVAIGASGSVVWAQVLDMAEADALGRDVGRYIARSTDGGRTFERILGQSREVPQYNQVPIWPDPVDAAAYVSLPHRLLSVDVGAGTVRASPTPNVDVAGIAFGIDDPSRLVLAVNAIAGSVDFVGPDVR